MNQARGETPIALRGAFGEVAIVFSRHLAALGIDH